MFKDSNSLKLLGFFWKIITYFTWHTTMLWKIKNVYRTFLSDLLTCDIFWCKGLNMAINVENKLLGSKLFALLSISFHLRKAELTIQQNHAYKMKTAKACIIFEFMFLSGHVRVSEWIHTLIVAWMSSNEFLDIQATIECAFTLKRICDMIRT